MSRLLFANMPVRDVVATRAFFEGLGFEFNDIFSDENTASMIVSDQATVMFLATSRFGISSPIRSATRRRLVRY